MTSSSKATFKVLMHRKAAKELDVLPADDRKRILNAIRDMASDPFSGDVKPIKGVRVFCGEESATIGYHSQ